ncbi:MAG: DUF1810 domain-containing protein [Chthoniobacterales bacterium]
MPDPFNLERFITAQEGIFETALQELTRGRKESHWMWFIFPQIAGLGSSTMAQRYAIQSRPGAEAYLSHPILSRRLLQCTETLLAVDGKSASEIMGYLDDMKLRSSMTLFADASGQSESVFHRVLNKYYGGEADKKTLSIIS